MDENADIGEYPTLVGVIYRDQFGNEEFGFAKVIDYDYKDKPDQETEIMIKYWDGNEEDFTKLCKELGIDVIKYPQCEECGKSIFGCFTVKNGKPLCFDCENKKETTDIKEEIEQLLKGAMTMQNEINKGIFNEVGIDYIVSELTREILKKFKK